jgi:hypothetical protein
MESAVAVHAREAVDCGDDVLDAFEASAADGMLGDESEPALDLIEPGGVSGRVMDVEARGLAASQRRTLACLWVE